MARKPAVAGMFYEDDANRLKDQIELAFKSSFGPGRVPEPIAKNKTPAAGIVPHAGYPFSAAGAAHFYSELAQSQKPDTFLILGTDHTGAGNVMSDQDFETPFGTAKIDKTLLEDLKKQGIEVNNSGHAREHSIEVQIPFLQFLYGDDFKFVPLIVGSYEGLSEKISKSVEGKNICIIVSSDFTHYGFSYGFIPFSPEEAKAKLPELDKGAIEFILKCDAKHFLGYLEDTGATICGFNGIAVLLELLKGKNIEGKLLKYYTSGDVTRDYSNAVGYATIIFK